MPDRVLHLAWRTKDNQNWSQDHGLTWAVHGAHIRKGFEGKMGMYMGIGLWSISSMKDDWIFTETATQDTNECIFTEIAEMFWEKS